MRMHVGLQLSEIGDVQKHSMFEEFDPHSWQLFRLMEKGCGAVCGISLTGRNKQ
jgi:hypothetical protein